MGSIRLEDGRAAFTLVRRQNAPGSPPLLTMTTAGHSPAAAAARWLGDGARARVRGQAAQFGALF